jgi:SWI/SNF-related matrix-associated actin-dependent regulator 1 of chromatin subfamily A
MAISLTKTKEAFDAISQYNGANPYLKWIKRSIIYDKLQLTDFQVEYILKNINFEPVLIDKVVKISQWFAEKKKEEWGLKFVPNKILIGWYLGETETNYHCMVKYKQNQEKAVQLFIPKKQLLDDFLIEDYNKLEIDFDKYDAITMAKDPTRKTMEHQKPAVKFLTSRKKCILADDMGLGKSASLSMSCIENNFNKVLIVCPASLKNNWKRELSWFVPESDITIIEGINDKNKGELEEWLGFERGRSGLKVDELKKRAKELGKWSSGTKFIIVNFDILDEFYQIPVSRSKENIKIAFENSPILKSGFDCLVVDEAHRLSNNKSTRTKIIKDLVKKHEFKAIYLATGTPIQKNPATFFNLLQIIGHRLANDYDYYVRTFCDAKQIPAKGEKQRITDIYLKQKGKEGIPFWKLNDEERAELDEKIKREAKKIYITSGASNLDMLADMVKDVYLRRMKTDIPGLPEKTIEEVYFDLTPLQRIEYNNLWDEYEQAQLEIDENKVLNRDLTEGTLFRTYLGTQMVPHTIKLAEEYIENDEKVVIFTCFDEELKLLKDYFGKKAVIFNGKCSPKQKQQAEDAFMNDPDIKVFIGQINAAGVGLTLTKSHICIFNNFDYAATSNLQAQDRVHRVSATEDVIIYYMMFNKTHSEHVWNIALKKEMIANTVIKEEKEK